MGAYFDQTPYAVRMDWGPRATWEAAARGDIVVVVDVLSFSTTVATGLHYGAELYPVGKRDDERRAKALAESLGAELTVGRAEALRTGGRSLSPGTFSPADAGKRFVLCSLNGALCAELGAVAQAVWAGCLLNAIAVAQAVQQMQQKTGAAITVIACGEVWENSTLLFSTNSSHSGQASVPHFEQRLRPGIEDYLGAGAIIAELIGGRSPEAEVCAGAFTAACDRLPELLLGCGSGRELAERGFADDVRHAMQVNLYNAAPLLKGGRFVDGSGQELL